MVTSAERMSFSINWDYQNQVHVISLSTGFYFSCYDGFMSEINSRQAAEEEKFILWLSSRCIVDPLVMCIWVVYSTDKTVNGKINHELIFRIDLFTHIKINNSALLSL